MGLSRSHSECSSINNSACYSVFGLHPQISALLFFLLLRASFTSKLLQSIRICNLLTEGSVLCFFFFFFAELRNNNFAWTGTGKLWTLSWNKSWVNTPPRWWSYQKFKQLSSDWTSHHILHSWPMQRIPLTLLFSSLLYFLYYTMREKCFWIRRLFWSWVRN